MNDQAIIELYWSRSESAIHETEKRYGRYCRTIAYNILVNREDAAECVNDTWLKAWRAIPPNRPTCLSAWLAKITRNLSLQRLQTRHAQKRGGGQTELAFSELEQVVSDSGSPAEAVDARELAATISAFLRELPEESRNAFIGRYFYFHDIRTIAAHLGISSSKTTTLLYRTRQGLKAYLRERGYPL